MAEGPLSPVESGMRQTADLLGSWKEIAAYLKRDIRTVQRWEKTEELPVRRHLHAKQGSVYAYRSEVDSWWRERQTQFEVRPGIGPGADGVVLVPEEPNVGPAAWPPIAQVPTPGSFLQNRISSWRGRSLAIILSFLVVTAAAGFYLLQDRLLGKPKVVSLAVMPFQNLSGDPLARSIADGLTGEMISRLGYLHPDRLQIIEVPPTYSTAEEVRQHLKVNYLLEGGVRVGGERLAITVQLLNAQNRAIETGNTYEGDWKDVIGTEVKVASSIVASLLAVLPRGNLPEIRVNPDAYEAYLTGRYFSNQRTTESLTKAVGFFQQAIHADPGYAPSYAGLADCYALLGSLPYAALPPREAFPKAEAAAQKALELNPALAEAHVSLGYSKLVYEWNFREAEKEFQEALKLRPEYAGAHQFYAYYLTAVGRLDEAIEHRKYARELDPTSPLLNSALGEAYYQARQFERTIELNQKSLALDPSYAIALVNIGRAYENKGMYEEALRAFQKIQAVAPEDPAVLALMGHCYAVSGKKERAREMLSKLRQLAEKRYVSSLYFALIYTGLGEKERGLEWLEKAFEERAEYLVYLPTEPSADPLRGDARFTALLHRVGLEAH